ncbi:MAG: diaminopimelate epimerase [Candidatus Altiarchaeales archaeon]|nr:MAG: diaminopimelate epimerase [Candidatus Altiarchaeales archaeon]
MKIPFTKMQGTGNDFVLIDESKKILISEEDKPEFVSRISDRHFGIGSDGVIFVQRSRKYDIRFSFYNPDGTKAEMCGNGIRCFAKYIYENGILRKERIEIETLAGLIVAELLVESGRVREVKVDMGVPRLERGDIPVSGDPKKRFIDQLVEIDGDLYRITAIGMGNPHAIIFSENLEDINVREIGKNIRGHTDLFPNGTNVHFVQRIENNEFKIRSYERGVENETLACGTGICASAVAAVLNKIADKDKPIKFHARGGNLRVEFKTMNEKIEKIFLIGPVETVFSGEIEY